MRPMTIRGLVAAVLAACTLFAAAPRAEAQLLDDPSEYKRIARGVSPYGDGLASGRILSVLSDHFQV